MQTFLPYSSFRWSASCLDRLRCGKQRVEGLQLLNILNDTTSKKGWQNHPATKMWRGYRGTLKRYVQSVIDEWVSRGYKNNIDLSQFADDENDNPIWLGDERFHISHRSNLIRKELETIEKGRSLDISYQNMWPDVSPDLPYIWPV
jgi:hypothetical protein